MSKNGLIDTHAHLDQVEDVADALDRARAGDVVAVIAVGMGLDSNIKIVELAEERPGYVFPALGVHPWSVDASELHPIVDLIEKHIDKCIAIGEIGLDYRIRKDRNLQKEVFRTMLEIAVTHEKPVLTHSRGSFEDVLQMVKDSGAEKAVFHWYSGPVELAEEIIRCGYHISATPAVEYSKKHREIIQMVPLENLLLETDCPVKYKETVSEPVSVGLTLQHASELKGLDADLVAEVTTKNAQRLFGLSGIGP